MNTIRIPRPLGTTLIGQQYNNNNTDENLYILQKHIVVQYINNNYMYNHKPMNIETFSLMTNIDMGIINRTIIEQGQIQFNNLYQEDQEGFLRASFFSILANALSDRSAALQHQNILVAAQGQNYLPFVSSEVTKALKLTQDSNTNLLNVLQKIAGPSAQGLTINNNITQTQNQAQGLTVHDAVNLIRSQADSPHSIPLLNDKPAMESLYLEYDLQSMPEVNANLQTGYDTSKEGLNFAKIAELSEEDDSLGHIDRRAEEFDVDLDSDNI